jgi:hypothetical protein
VNKADFSDVACKLLAESRFNDDMFARLSSDGGRVDGHIGLRYLIDMHRRYVEWALPLLKVLSDSICTLEGQPVLRQ